jgi:ElaB/YqjD/DUF883 family membrane-anchored ribosome-binding protein
MGREVVVASNNAEGLLKKPVMRLEPEKLREEVRKLNERRMELEKRDQQVQERTKQLKDWLLSGENIEDYADHKAQELRSRIVAVLANVRARIGPNEEWTEV